MIGSGTTIQIKQASATVNGYLSSIDWTTFNSKQTQINGTGFVKATGTTISYDNSTYYLASNPSSYITLASLSGTTPISYNSGTGAISIALANTSTSGYLSSTDWNTFNSKASLTAFSASPPLSYNSGTGAFSITQSSGSTNGYLSSTDWTTFNNKQSALTNPVTGTGTSGYVVKFNGSTTVTNSIIQDSGTDLTIGGSGTFSGNVTINKNNSTDSIFKVQQSTNFYASAINLVAANDGGAGYNFIDSSTNGGSIHWQIGGGGLANTMVLFTAGTERIRITSGGNVLIGTTTDAGYKLDVNGTVRSTGGFFDTSDSRLKILVKDYKQPKGIENVAARFYVKNNKQELGYYAQDLQEILPSSVIEGEDGFLSLSYTQVHTAKIAHLEKEIEELKQLIKTLL